MIKVHRVFSQIMAWAVRDARIATNPADGIRLPRTAVPDHRYLTHDQVAALANRCGTWGIVVRFLAYTGLRWGELAALTAGRVDLARRRAAVAASVTEVNGRLVWGNPKNHERRSVPIPRFVATELAERIAGRAPGELVFTAPQGGVLRVRNFRRQVFDRAVRGLVRSGSPARAAAHRCVSRDRFGSRSQGRPADAGAQDGDHDPRPLWTPVSGSAGRDCRPHGPGCRTCPDVPQEGS